MAANPFDTWPRLVDNPGSGCVVERTMDELRTALVRAAEKVTDLLGRASLNDERQLRIEDDGVVELLTDLYRFFDNGTWSTPTVEAWCVTSPPPLSGWERSVRAAFLTREEAEEFLPQMRAFYAARYPHQREEELLVERAVTRVTQLKRRPGQFCKLYDATGRCEDPQHDHAGAGR